jgi:hypothetical protein
VLEYLWDIAVRSFSKNMFTDSTTVLIGNGSETRCRWKSDMYQALRHLRNPRITHQLRNTYPLHSKNDSVESTFLRRRINVNSHTLSVYGNYNWFYCILHRFYVSGVFYGKNNYMSRRRFEPTTVRTLFGIKTLNWILAFTVIRTLERWTIKCR